MLLIIPGAVLLNSFRARIRWGMCIRVVVGSIPELQRIRKFRTPNGIFQGSESDGCIEVIAEAWIIKCIVRSMVSYPQNAR